MEDYEQRKIKNLTLSRTINSAKSALAVHPNKNIGDQTWRKMAKLSELIRRLLMRIPEYSTSSVVVPRNNSSITWVSHDRHISGTNLRKTFLPHTSALRTKLQYKLYNDYFNADAKSNISEEHQDKSLHWIRYNKVYHAFEPLVGLHIHAENDYTLLRDASFTQGIPDSKVPVRAKSRLLHRFGSPVVLTNEYQDNCKLNIAVTLSGRLFQLERLSNNLVKLSKQCTLHLAMSVYETSESNVETVTDKLRALLSHRVTFGVTLATGSFSRSAGINKAFEEIVDDAPTLITDIDMVFDIEFLHRCQRYPFRRHRLYFPIVLSGFNQKYESISDGYWREFGFGMVCLYPSDYHNIGGLSESFKEWGEEDVDFVSKAAKVGYEIFRFILSFLLQRYSD